MSDCSVYVAQIKHYRSLLVLLSDALSTKAYLSAGDHKLIEAVSRLQEEWTPTDPTAPDPCEREDWVNVPGRYL